MADTKEFTPTLKDVIWLTILLLSGEANAMRIVLGKDDQVS